MRSFTVERDLGTLLKSYDTPYFHTWSLIGNEAALTLIYSLVPTIYMYCQNCNEFL
jgi:hypothetical protein